MKIETKNYPPVTSEQIKPSSEKQGSKNGNILTAAVKAYRDEMLTGLTDEEKEEIEKKLKEYVKSHPIKTEADKRSLVNYVASLLSQYGFKGDCMEQATGMVSDAMSKNKQSADNANTSEENILKVNPYQKSIIEGETARLRVLKEV